MFSQSRLKIILIFLAATLAIFWPFLFGGRVIAEKFTSYHQLPFLSFIGESLKQYGDTPFWAPGYLGGFPYFLGQYSYFYPFSLIFKWLNFITAFHLLVAASFFLSLILTFLFGRSLKFSKPAAITTAFVYTFSHLNMWWGSILPFAFVIPIVPAVFLSILKINHDKKKFIILGALALTFGWYSGFSEYVFYTSAMAALFALYLDIVTKKYSWRFWKSFNALKSALAMIILSIVLALPRLLPTIAFIKYSPRSSGVPEPTSFLGLGDLVLFLYPYLNIPFTDVIPLLRDHWFYLHITIPIGILAILFFLNFRRIVSSNKIIWFFAALFLIGFLMLIKQTYLFKLFQLLTLHLFRGAWKFLFLGNFALAILAGSTLDNLDTIRSNGRFRIFSLALKKVTIIVFVLLGALNVSVLLFKGKILDFANEVFIEKFYKFTTGQPLEYYRTIVEKTFNQTIGALVVTNYHFVFYIIFAVLFIISLLKYQKGDWDTAKFKKTAVVIVILNFIFLWQGFYQTLPRRLVLNEPQTVKFLKNNSSEPFRVFRFWPGFSKYYRLGLDRYDKEAEFELNKELLTANMNVTYGVESIEGDENFIAARHSRLLAELGSFKAHLNESRRWIYSDMPFEEKLERFQKYRSIWSAMNVKYILSSFELNRPLKKVFETKVTRYQLPIYIYENIEVLPRVYFANSIKYIDSDNEEALGELFQNPDFKKTTLIECPADECGNLLRPDKNDSVEIIKYKPGYLKLKTRIKSGRWLVFSESNLPTWEAILAASNKQQETSGGKTENLTNLKIYSANYLYQAIQVPAGENEIEFKYFLVSPNIF